LARVAEVAKVALFSKGLWRVFLSLREFVKTTVTFVTFATLQYVFCCKPIYQLQTSKYLFTPPIYILLCVNMSFEIPRCPNIGHETYII
jgi:hypothetical protein